MALTQKHGIKYPFSSDNIEEVYLDLNTSIADKVKSDVLHVLFTPKGQRLRQPEFGTDLIKYLFDQKDEGTFNSVKQTIMSDVCRYISNIEFNDIRILQDDNDDRGVIVVVEYSVIKGNKKEKTQVAVKV